MSRSPLQRLKTSECEHQTHRPLSWSRSRRSGTDWRRAAVRARRTPPNNPAGRRKDRSEANVNNFGCRQQTFRVHKTNAQETKRERFLVTAQDLSLCRLMSKQSLNDIFSAQAAVPVQRDHTATGQEKQRTHTRAIEIESPRSLRRNLLTSHKSLTWSGRLVLFRMRQTTTIGEPVSAAQ